ncbi:MAG: DNA repair exonuclease [Candidatus Woesearchaeota archaeon]
MKFAHLADCHLGAWREPKLRDLNLKAFSKAIDLCINEKVDFVVIAGDLFNNSYPSHDSLMSAVIKLRELREKSIPVYVIAGSHDFSATGKTMIDVLEEAGLLVNVAAVSMNEGNPVFKLTLDTKTGVFLCGIPGLKGMLDKKYYESIKQYENKPGYKIFLFHTTLTELKPSELKEAESLPLSLLPKGFSYYAGGHVHYVFEKTEPGYGTIAFPGPTFPNNMKEVEDLGRGGLFIVDNGIAKWHPIQVLNTFVIDVDCDHKSPQQVESAIVELSKNKEFNETLVALRLHGTLGSGSPADIDFKKVYGFLYDKSAYFVMKNTAKLASKEFVQINVEHKSVEEMEAKLIREHLDQVKGPSNELEATKDLMHALGREKPEGEKVSDFESRIVKESMHALDLG